MGHVVVGHVGHVVGGHVVMGHVVGRTVVGSLVVDDPSRTVTNVMLVVRVMLFGIGSAVPGVIVEE